MDAWCIANRVHLCVFLADSQDTPTAHIALQHGYTMLDFRVTLDREMSAPIPAPKYPTRVYQDSDLSDLERIAQASFMDSRFLIDPFFPAKERSKEMYARWIRRRSGGLYATDSFAPADHIVVADFEGEPAGFVTCLLRPPDADGVVVGSVDLVAVDQRARGLYIGESMVCAALAWFNDQNCQRVEVVTQGRNVRAQRVYQRCGFLTRRAQTWYHKWFTTSDA
jgi:ribosomal protein S18 acetylase RimI-like enzyme